MRPQCRCSNMVETVALASAAMHNRQRTQHLSGARAHVVAKHQYQNTARRALDYEGRVS